MDTPVVPVKSRKIRLSYPCAALATAMIVGGAPPAAPGLMGCAAPAAQGLGVAAAPPPAVLGSAAAVPLMLAPLPAPSASSRALVEGPAASADITAPAPPIDQVATEPAAPPHVWKGGEFQRALTQLAQWVKKNGGALGAELDDVASGSVLGSVSANAPENPASNQKILTTAAVLHHFGAEYRFRTSVCGARTGDSVPKLVL